MASSFSIQTTWVPPVFNTACFQRVGLSGCRVLARPARTKLYGVPAAFMPQGLRQPSAGTACLNTATAFNPWHTLQPSLIPHCLKRVHLSERLANTAFLNGNHLHAASNNTGEWKIDTVIFCCVLGEHTCDFRVNLVHESLLAFNVLLTAVIR